MNLFYGLAHFRKFVGTTLGSLLTSSPCLLFELVVAFIRRLFVADGVRFLFVDRLFFQGPRRGESHDLFTGSDRVVGHLGNRSSLVFFFRNFLHA